MKTSAQAAFEAEIADLEEKLRAARDRLNRDQDQPNPSSLPPDLPPSYSPSQHGLLLLADSALPLGSFAYSSGLESYIAHQKALKQHDDSQLASFQRFFRLSIESVAFSNLPFLTTSFRQPSRLGELDNDLDASTPCSVVRRASVAQGKALLSVWDKALRNSINLSTANIQTAMNSITSCAGMLKHGPSSTGDVPQFNGHFAPAWGAISLTLGLELHQATYLFLFNQAKALLSAAVRASVLGPYQSQSMLAGAELQAQIRTCLERAWNMRPDEASQVVPAMDLWAGRHDLLYSRIFNS